MDFILCHHELYLVKMPASKTDKKLLTKQSRAPPNPTSPPWCTQVHFQWDVDKADTAQKLIMRLNVWSCWFCLTWLYYLHLNRLCTLVHHEQHRICICKGCRMFWYKRPIILSEWNQTGVCVTPVLELSGAEGQRIKPSEGGNIIEQV